MRVLVVSDVRVVQQGLSAILAERGEIEIVGTADVSCAPERCIQLHPDVLLFDAARRARVGGAAELVAWVPDVKIVAFGVEETGDEVLALAAAGTAGYVHKSADCADLVRVLEGVMCDELPCSARAAASLYHSVAALTRARRDAWTAPAPDSLTCALPLSRVLPLSRRELEIVHLIDGGLPNKQIARQLGIEVSTVKNHVHNLCEKLKVHRRGEAAALLRVLALR
jgi:DNA-binding NarL/FixJ family response regulator